MQLSRNEKELVAELMREDGNVIASIGEAVGLRMWREFQNATPIDRLLVGHKFDALADVMREFQTIANEVAVSGRIDRIA